MRIPVMNFAAGLICLFSITILHAQQNSKVFIHFNDQQTYQTIDNFGASDAWACQFAGNWPKDKKNKIADWLFSFDTLSIGNPIGIGLSMWRYNLGAGSAEQQDSSGIKDEWRRAALTTNKSSSESKKVQAQNWFLQAAKQRGVQQFLGFFNSPPVHLTKNGKAYANKGLVNIDSNNYKAFAEYTLKAMKEIREATGVMFDYISPVNEPQWDWSDGGQEGCPYTNNEIYNLVKTFSKTFQQNKVNTKLLITEAGDLKYLLIANNKKDKDQQVHDFFQPSSENYVGNLPNVSRTIAAHSYFTTSPFADAMALRSRVKDSIAQMKSLSFWQSEYCILGDNAGEINGNKKDLGMNAALYVGKVIFEDLVGTNASAWQWWIALSAYNYKDGLIYLDKKPGDGNFSDSKILWVLGNYSRFIRPGMKRIHVADKTEGLLVSGFKDLQKDKLVFVVVNETGNEKPVALENAATLSKKIFTVYTTDATNNLEKKIVASDEIVIPAQSVVTIIIN